MNSLPDVVTWSALGVSVAAIISSALLAGVGRRISKLKAENGTNKPKERDYKTEVRLVLVHAILMREIERCKVFRIASCLLVFSQFVVGGLLASSFIIKTLGESLIGFFGIVVLAASLIQQHFRPDLLHKVSAEKLRRLRSLNRELEDQLYISTRTEVSNEELIRIRLHATASLERIEASEHFALQNEKQQTA